MEHTVTVERHGDLQSPVIITLTWRDILLLKTCLNIIVREHVTSGNLHFDIQKLQERLSLEMRSSQDNHCVKAVGKNNNKHGTKEVSKVKIVELCGSGHCPVVKIADERIEIGEKDNVCVLTKDEWNTLKQKIVNGEI